MSMNPLNPHNTFCINGCQTITWHPQAGPYNIPTCVYNPKHCAVQPNPQKKCNSIGYPNYPKLPYISGRILGEWIKEVREKRQLLWNQTKPKIWFIMSECCCHLLVVHFSTCVPEYRMLGTRTGKHIGSVIWWSTCEMERIAMYLTHSCLGSSGTLAYYQESGV